MYTTKIMKFLIRLLITSLALLAATQIIPGIVVAGWFPALMAAFFLGLLNAVVRPILVLLTLPVTILTLGLFIFVINAGIFLFVASFLDGFAVSGFLSALVGSIFVSIASGIAHKIT